MDSTRFDSLVKELSTGTSRRRVLRGFIGGVAAATVLGRSAAEAAPNSCAAGCAKLHGASGAQCRQACKQCGGDFSNVCMAEGPGGATSTCCSTGQGCNYNCETGQVQCCVEDICGLGSCGSTCGYTC